MKIIKKILLGLLLVLIVMQFIRPDKNQSEEIPVTDIIFATKPSDEIASILKTSCYDCHSNNTEYPWYANVAPVSYWISDHVDHGKGHLNFSEWETYTDKKKAHKMEEIAEEVEAHKMPLESYLWMHGEAKLSQGQIDLLVNWAKTTQVKYETALK
ncbi:Haem-binding domain-containing protein [Zhouia amylolytica]|uniref:Haem-binding domain-containing protein n=1 Tax=Zhouia amylolytica TaxID=376730 RepID=A0A1I6QKB1_9FLAO|nr:heme-binding domain-containing protein [Zhouia amylolytica]SFS52889.1 Haem-binding domain-containing protein [Zhouia amylolytica]